jgi:hypothetical protein
MALAAIEAHEPKALFADSYYYEACGGHCAIGVLLPYLRGNENIADLLSQSRVAKDIAALGLTDEEACELQYQNDEGAWRGESPFERHARMVSWLRERVAEETAGGAS